MLHKHKYVYYLRENQMAEVNKMLKFGYKDCVSCSKLNEVNVYVRKMYFSKRRKPIQVKMRA